MIVRRFGRDEQTFRLKLANWREVEKRCDAGLGEIAARLAPVVRLLDADLNTQDGLLAVMAHGGFGSARVDDVREPILQALIGGGKSSTEAGALVAMVFDEAITAGRAPMLEFGYLAFEVVADALIGLEDERLGETKAAEQQPRAARRRSREARPGSRKSTPPPP